MIKRIKVFLFFSIMYLRKKYEKTPYDNIRSTFLEHNRYIIVYSKPCQFFRAYNAHFLIWYFKNIKITHFKDKYHMGVISLGVIALIPMYHLCNGQLYF